MLILARELRKIDEKEVVNLLSQSEEISKILSGLIKTL